MPSILEANVSARDLDAAAQRLRGVAFRTPLVFSPGLSRLFSCRVFLKLENVQRTASYKVRGAYNMMKKLVDAGKPKGFVTASAGNHAQGVGYSAQRLGLEKRTIVVMPRKAPDVKVDRTREYGVRVVLEGDGFFEADAHADQLGLKKHYVKVPAFDNWDIIAGQGTVGLEIMEDLQLDPAVEGPPDVIIAPVGGGGLLNGIKAALLARDVRTRLVGVQPARAPSMIEAIKQGEPVTLPGKIQTIADGAGVARTGALTFAAGREFFEEGSLRFVTATDPEIAFAMQDLYANERIVAEGAAVLGVAGLRIIKNELHPSDVVVIIVSGRNVMANSFLRYVGWRPPGTRLELRVFMKDQHGELSKVLRPLADLNCNIREIDVCRWHPGHLESPEKDVVIDMVLDVDERVTREKILVKLSPLDVDIEEGSWGRLPPPSVTHKMK